MRLFVVLMLLTATACSKSDELLEATLSPRSPEVRIYAANAWGMSGSGRMVQQVEDDPNVRVVLNKLLFDRDVKQIGHLRLIWIGNDGEKDLYRVAVAEGIEGYTIDQLIRYGGGKMILLESDTQQIWLDDTEAADHRLYLTGDVSDG